MRFRLLLLAFLLCIGLVPAVAEASGRRVALVVGNSSYQAAGTLKNPVNDARAMARALRERGFEVILRENTGKVAFERAVQEFGEKLDSCATALFFFAGHGFQVNGRNYLVPVDANITTEQSVRLQAVDADVVIDQMIAARSAVNMVILDACRNNPFERRFRSTGGGLAQINAPQGTLIAYATAPGRVAADGDGANGLYTEELLRAMAEPGLKVEDVFKQARIRVARRSNDQQIPWEASSLVGDFYFTPGQAASAPALPAPAPAADPELVFWQSVQDSQNPAELRAYMSQYPQGRFVTLAQVRLRALTQEAGPPAGPAAMRVGKAIDQAESGATGRPQIASLPPPPPSLGAAATGIARFDGHYSGAFECDAGSSGVAAQGPFTMEIRNGQIAFKRGFQPRGIEGEERTTGTVSEDGSFRLRGEMRGKALAGPNAGRVISYDVSYSGRIAGAAFEATGNHVSERWVRACKMVGKRYAE
ncbi:MAG: caspase family protein [Alphaproteobacteria bacterium]|nr:caspase family protein [Alphaproteobacteria bacterium]